MPEKFEDFLEIFCRAFPSPSAGPDESDRMLVRALARAVWERLHVYEQQVKQEEARLRRVLDEVGGEAVGSYKDLRKRSHLIEFAFKTDPALRPMMVSLELDIELATHQLLERRYSSNLGRVIFPPPQGMPAPPISTWSSAV